MLRISRHRSRLRSIHVEGLDIRFDIWLVHTLHVGALARPVRAFEQVLGRRFGRHSP
jgi:hypothetical protein